MSSGPASVVKHRICPSCDLEITDGSGGPMCPNCGTKLVEIRDDADDLIGTVIDDRFEIRAKLGQGGMGTVYRAWQRSVGREVAIKLIDQTYTRDPMSVRRFLREARLASQLSQPNTVSVFDFGQCADGRLFIAMELIRGRTLQKVIESEGTFTIERAIRIGVQICDALEAAHAVGIIHRDLKLENVIVLDHPPGRDLLKVLDFGLAKNIREPGSRGTESGVVVGTPRYMSPEAAMTGESLPAGDLYALGVIVGELAAGKPLWEGENLPHLVNQKLDPTPVLALVPPALAKVVGALIDPDPERRPTAPQARAMLVAAGEGDDAGATMVDALQERVTAPMRTPREQATVRSPTPEQLAKQPLATPAPSITDDLPRPARGRRIVLWSLAAIAFGFGVGSIAVLASRSSSPKARDAGIVAAHEDAPVAPPDEAAAETPAFVTLHVTSQPSGAEITLADKPGPIVTTPGDLVLPYGTDKLHLKATLAGHQPMILDVTPNAEQSLAFPLKRKTGGVRTPNPDDKVPF